MSSSRYENFQAVSVLLVMFGVGAIALSPSIFIKKISAAVTGLVVFINLFMSILSIIIKIRRDG